MYNIKQKLLQMFKVSFGFIFLYLFGIAILDPSLSFYYQSSFVLLLMVVLVLMLGIKICKMIFNTKDRNKHYIIILSFVIIFILQLAFAYYMRVTPTWDFNEVFKNSIGMANSNIMDYELPFYFWGRYPNNIGSVILLAIPLKLVSLFTTNFEYYYLFAIMLNILTVDFALAIMIYIIYKNINLNAATIASIFMIFITPLYAYVTIVYTDTLAMIFPILSILFLMLSNNNEKKSILYLVLSISTLIIGSWIKTNVMIFLIAVLIYIFYKYSGINLLKRFIAIIVIVVIMQSAYSACVQKIVPIPMEDAGFPPTHWVMMGMNGVGGWSEEDVNFTSNIYDEYGKKEVLKENLRVIKDRLQNYGFSGYGKFLEEKMKITWNDGAYFSPNKLSRQPYKPDSYLYKHVVGEDNKAFVYISQISHILVLFGIFLSALFTIKSKMNILTLAQMAIFGNWLFLLLWETRSRYLVYTLPVMIFLAIYGYYLGYKKIENKKHVIKLMFK